MSDKAKKVKEGRKKGIKQSSKRKKVRFDRRKFRKENQKFKKEKESQKVQKHEILLEFHTRVQENTRPHNVTTNTDEHFNPTTHQQGWRSDLDSSFFDFDFDRLSVGGSWLKKKQTTVNSASPTNEQRKAGTRTQFGVSFPQAHS